MDAATRIEQALTVAVARAGGPGCPPRLAEAVRHAVFPRGARIRPRLTLAVAEACGGDDPGAADAAAAAIELLHCASLVHDDLPCFDDAATRRGKPSVHRAFGEPLAVLAGDALIVLAFQTLARGAVQAPDRLAALVMTLGQAVGSHPASSPGRPGSASPRGPSSPPTTAPRPGRCSRARPSPGPRPPAPTPPPGARSASCWGSPSRPPTTSATPRATRTSSASRSAAMRRWAARASCASSASRVPSPGSS